VIDVWILIELLVVLPLVALLHSTREQEAPWRLYPWQPPGFKVRFMMQGLKPQVASVSISTWLWLALSARSTWKSAWPWQSHIVSLILQGPTSKVRVLNAMMSAFSSRANVFGDFACKHCK
jgi:cytoskeletal protein RodZ